MIVTVPSHCIVNKGLISDVQDCLFVCVNMHLHTDIDMRSMGAGGAAAPPDKLKYIS